MGRVRKASGDSRDRSGFASWRTLALALGSGALVSCGGLIAEGDGSDGGGGSTLASEARVVVATYTQDYAVEVLLCRTNGEPVSLGFVSSDVLTPGALVSPDGRFVAVDREEGVVIVNLSTLAEAHVPGDGTSVWRARWSPGSDRLAYFAGGVPWLAAAAGDWATEVRIDLPPPPPAGEYVHQAAEWSADGQQVAFITRRQGILANRDGEGAWVFSERMIGSYGTPWALAFSPDGTTLAGLQTDEPNSYVRTVLVLAIPNRAAREFELFHYSFMGWAPDGSGVTLMDVDIHTWLVPKDGGEPRDLGYYAQISPSTPEVALPGAGLPVENLQDGSVRTLLPESEYVNSVTWEAGGDILWYAAPGGSGYLRAADGAPLGGFESLQVQGVVSDDGWVALADPAVTYPYYPTELLIWDLFAAAPSVVRVPWDGGNAPYLHLSNAQWLPGGRLAFLGADGVHVVRRDGSDLQLICPPSAQIYRPQSDAFTGR